MANSPQNYLVGNAYGNNRVLEYPDKAVDNETVRVLAGGSIADMDAALIVAGYTQEKLNKLTVNDKIFALRKINDVQR